MRKLFVILTFALAYIAASGAAIADGGSSPTCGESCPWYENAGN